MSAVTIHKAKTNLSRLIKKAANGRSRYRLGDMARLVAIDTTQRAGVNLVL